MRYHDLRDFLQQLERLGELKRIAVEVDPRLEMTEIGDRVLRAGGPALLFERPKGHSIPVLTNLFGTVKRVALGMARRTRRSSGRSAGCSPTSRSRSRPVGSRTPGRSGPSSSRS